MSNFSALQIEKARNWLKNDTFPLWRAQGVDRERGGFIESIVFAEGKSASLAGNGASLDFKQGIDETRRTMVQCRQIYSFAMAGKMKFLNMSVSKKTVLDGVLFLMCYCSLPNGSFVYSVGAQGDSRPDLYTQAFVLFGLAQAYGLSGDVQLKNRALHLVKYLRSERAVPTGGFTELSENGEKIYRSNPHMHLFEAFLAWMQVDQAPLWRELAGELADLCVSRFVDTSTGLLAEHFNDHWEPIRVNGLFYFEPGHQYEWSWLFGVYERLVKKDFKPLRESLFRFSEKHGICPTRRAAIDELWSDFNPKKTTARFWPQCERIKAAIGCGRTALWGEQPEFARAADEAVSVLFKYFETPVRGLWYDTMLETGEFKTQPAKASSLYHIVNALDEYITYRDQLSPRS